MEAITVGMVITSQALWDEIQSTQIHDVPARVVMEERQINDWTVFIEQLDRIRPEVVLLQLGALSEELAEAVRRVKASAGSPQVILVHTSADPELVVQAIRADADEFLFPPIQADLRKALQRMATERAKRMAGTRPRGKVIGVFSAKGGCGATTVVCHLALELRRHTELTVLLADLDLDGGLIGFLLKSHHRYSVLDALDNIHRLDVNFWKALVSNGTPGIELIAAPPYPGHRPTRELEDFRYLISFFRAQYDWTVADLGRSISPLAKTLIGDFDQVFLVTTLEIPALHQVKQIMQSLFDSGSAHDRIHLLLNRMPKRSEVTPQELERMLRIPIYATLPNEYQELHEAYSEGGLLPANSKLRRHFSLLAAKLAGIEQPQHRKKAGFLRTSLSLRSNNS